MDLKRVKEILNSPTTATIEEVELMAAQIVIISKKIELIQKLFDSLDCLIGNMHELDMIKTIDEVKEL